MNTPHYKPVGTIAFSLTPESQCAITLAWSESPATHGIPTTGDSLGLVTAIANTVGGEHWQHSHDSEGGLSLRARFTIEHPYTGEGEAMFEWLVVWGAIPNARECRLSWRDYEWTLERDESGELVEIMLESISVSTVRELRAWVASGKGVSGSPTGVRELVATLARDPLL